MASEIGAIMDKIARLKSLHERPGTPEEAAAAASAIQRLMRKYNLTQMQVNTASRNTETGFDKFEVDLGAATVWKQSLMNHIAEASYCTFIRQSSGRTGSIVGEKHNVIMVKELYEFLVTEIERLADRGYRALGWTDRSWKHSFKSGAAGIVAKRISDDAREQKREQEAQTNALVVLYEEDLKNAVTKFFPRISYRTTQIRAGSMSGYREGQEAGRNINLAKQIGNA